MNVMEMLQKQFQDSANSLQTVQREYSKMLTDRQTLDSQLNENRQVRRGQCCTEERTLKLVIHCTKTHDVFVKPVVLYVCGVLMLNFY